MKKKTKTKIPVIKMKTDLAGKPITPHPGHGPLNALLPCDECGIAISAHSTHRATCSRRGIASSADLVAPTPRRDPIDCLLEDANDYLNGRGFDNDQVTSLIDRLADTLRTLRDLYEDLKDEHEGILVVRREAGARAALRKAAR